MREVGRFVEITNVADQVLRIRIPQSTLDDETQRDASREGCFYFFKINFFGIAMPKAVVLDFLPMLKTGKAKVKRFAKLIARRRAKAKATSERP